MPVNLVQAYDPLENHGLSNSTVDWLKETGGDPLPDLLKPPPSFFEGALSAIPSGIGYGVETTVGAAFDLAGSLSGSEKAHQTADEIYKHAETQLGVNSDRYGAAAQIVHGVSSFAPDIVAGLGAGTAVKAGIKKTVGSLAMRSGGVQAAKAVVSSARSAQLGTQSTVFGALAGDVRYHELVNRGVDEDTALGGAIASFAANAIGMRIPVGIKGTVARSATYGAIVNTGLSLGEASAIQSILNRNDYPAEAREHSATLATILTAGVMGGLFGSVARPGSGFGYGNAAFDPIEQRFYEGLRDAGFSEREARYQAITQAQHARVTAQKLGLPAESIVPTIVKKNPDGSVVVRLSDAERPNVVHPLASGSADGNGGMRFEQRTFQHGGGADFDKFDLSYAGSGEGGSVHGHGVYLSGSRNVSKKYWAMNSTAGKGVIYTVSNVPENHEMLVEASSKQSSHVNSALKKMESDGYRISAPKTSEEIAKELGYVAENYIVKNSRGPIKNSANGFNKSKFDQAIKNISDDISSGKSIEDAFRNRSQELRDAGVSSEQIGSIRKSADTMLNKKANGRNLYSRIASQVGSEKLASELFNKYGIKGMSYVGKFDGEGVVVFSDKDLKIVQKDKPGQVEHQSNGWFDEEANEIVLTPNADISTFSHEMSHWFVSVVAKQIASGAKISPSLRADFDILLKEFGLKTFDDFKALDESARRNFFERVAAWTEIYLSEGRAPVPRLQRFFEQMGEWIRGVYASFLGGTAEAVGKRYKEDFGVDLPPLSEEVRGVLDRSYKFDDFRLDEDAAAREMQTQALSDSKAQALLRGSDDPLVRGKNEAAAQAAGQKAVDDINAGRPVDVSELADELDVDSDRVNEAEKMLQEQVEKQGDKFVDDGRASAPEGEPEKVENRITKRTESDDVDSIPKDDVQLTMEKIEQIAKDRPDIKYVMTDDNGNSVSVTASQFLEESKQLMQEAKADGDAVLQAAMCMVRFGGLREGE